MSDLSLFDLTGRTAAVTGGAGGIGRGCAEALAQAGANVVIGDIDLDRAERTAKEISAAWDGQCAAVLCDVTDEGSVADLVAAAGSQFGPLDIMVNNAGITDPELALLHEASVDSFDRTVAINLRGVYFGVREALKVMAPRRSGRIINIASMWGFVGTSSVAPALGYSTSKGGVLNLTREAALQYAEAGITVNSICPGFVHTAIGGGMYEDQATYDAFVSQTPQKRVASIDELKGLVIYLASDSSSFMTGSNLVIDGGFTAR